MLEMYMDIYYLYKALRFNCTAATTVQERTQSSRTSSQIMHGFLPATYTRISYSRDDYKTILHSCKSVFKDYAHPYWLLSLDLASYHGRGGAECIEALRYQRTLF